MGKFILILQLALPGYAEPIRGEIEQPSFEACQLAAVMFLQTFRKESPEGGQAMAGCVVVISPRQDASDHNRD